MNANEARPVFPFYPFQGFPFLPKLPGDTTLHPSNQDGGYHHLERNYHAPQSPPSSPPVGAGSLDLSRKNERISPNSFSGRECFFVKWLFTLIQEIFYLKRSTCWIHNDTLYSFIRYSSFLLRQRWKGRIVANIAHVIHEDSLG